MTDKRFYDDEEEEELEEGTEEEETEGSTEEESTEEPEAKSFSAEDVENRIQNRLHRERKKVAKELGTSMEEAKEYMEAGRHVTQASGLTPAQVRQRLVQQQQQSGQQGYNQGQQQQSYNPPPVDDDVRKELKELRGILTDQQMRDKREKEVTQARQEFGGLYDEHDMEIEDKAEDLDISVIDAAAMVLRPKLRDHYETRTKKKQQTKKRRKLEGSGEGPSKSENAEEVLSEDQKRVAKGMRIPLDKYLKRLKEKGEV